MQWKWHAVRQKGRRFHVFYADRKEGPRGRQRHVLMHRALTGWHRTDHIDGNGLNNQRYNLREVTHAQNSYNSVSRHGSSRYKGVSWWKNQGKWTARLAHNGQDFWLGYYTDEIEAALAYDRAAREQFGEYAVLNFPAEMGE